MLADEPEYLELIHVDQRYSTTRHDDTVQQEDAPYSKIDGGLILCLKGLLQPRKRCRL